MSNRKVYLRQNVQVEPLFNQWYAWTYLISPATAPMYIANQHLKVMQSFIASPDIHVAALKNPDMLGGPFINYDAGKVKDIKALYERTRDESALSMKFADAVQVLNKLLLTEANGLSLEPFYSKIPEILRGYVELVYDLNNRASIRFIEGLLYRSPFYDQSKQSLAFSLTNSDNRPFIFSTPNLGGDHQWDLHVPFADPRLDELFTMKSSPRPYADIRETLEVRERDEALFSSLFTEEAPPASSRHQLEETRIRYFGHACILIESAATSILTDPVISYSFKEASDRYTFADLPDVIDYVVITHGHQDHCMLETLLQLRPRIKNLIVPRSNGGMLADPSLKLALENVGFRNVRELAELDSIKFDDGEIVGLPFMGEHGDLNITTKLAYLVRVRDKSIICAADSNNIEPKLYEHLHKLFGDIDVLFLGMECEGGPLTWLYGPLLTTPITRKMDQSRRFDGSNYEKAISIVDHFRPRSVYVYAMGQEPWLSYLTSIHYTEESRPIIESNRLVAECRKRGITSERLFGCKEIF